MQDSISVITQAAKGIGEKIADFWEVGNARAYEILGKDNPYPKFRRLVRAIAAVTKGEDRRRRLSIIKADVDAFFAELFNDGEPRTEIDACRLCEELHDVMRTKLAGMPKAERIQECREAIGILQQEITSLESD